MSSYRRTPAGNSYGNGGYSASSSATRVGGGSSLNSGIRGYAAASRESRNQYHEEQEQRQFDDEDEEVDFIKSRITKAKQETLDSTRNALRTLEQTEQVGVSTLTKLGEQTEQINRIDRTMELTHLEAANSVEQTSKLRTLNKSIFHMHIKNPFSGKKRREAEIAKIEAEQEHVRLAEERKAKNDFESRQRVQQFAGNGARGGYGGPAGRMTASGHNILPTGGISNSERSKYTFEDEDPEVEDEINDNLNQMSAAVGRLKDLSLATKRELEAQDDPLRRITDTADQTSDRIGVAKFNLDRIK
ncbi:Protein transport protein S9 plasma membrane t-SNARE [Dipsacomyces acuminosporus]|nr:Protein transport protein S9 plasma membrane t-SNARE [Dipsacomyces acuminosporus]